MSGEVKSGQDREGEGQDGPSQDWSGQVRKGRNRSGKVRTIPGRSRSKHAVQVVMTIWPGMVRSNMFRLGHVWKTGQIRASQDRLNQATTVCLSVVLSHL